MLWVEVRATVRRAGPPRLVPLADVDRYRGFRSVVAYPDATADLIRQQGHTVNLRGAEVYADTLFMDFDSHDPTEFRSWLQGSGLAYTEWDSGNRSVHFHIPLVPITGGWVPLAMKRWVQERAPTADVSFYHAAGQYRLPGTYHWKSPGRRKVCVAQQAGSPLALSPPAVAAAPEALAEEGTLEVLFQRLLVNQNEGNRRPYIWFLATTAAECGMEFGEAVDHLEWWNSRFCHPPHPSEVIESQCASAFHRLRRVNEP